MNDYPSKYIYTLNNKTTSNKNDQPEFITSYANSNQYASNLDCYSDYNQKMDDFDQFNYKSIQKDLLKKSSSFQADKPQVESKKNVKPTENTTTAAKKTESKPTNKSIKQEIKCHKKFSIGSYVHMLNEPVEPERDTKKKTGVSDKKKITEEDSDDLSEEQIIDDYYQSLQHKNNQLKSKTENKNKKEPQQQQQQQSSNKQTISGSTDLDKIAAKINSTGQQKWKNSTMPAKSCTKIELFFFLNFSNFFREIILLSFLSSRSKTYYF